VAFADVWEKRSLGYAIAIFFIFSQVCFQSKELWKAEVSEFWGVRGWGGQGAVILTEVSSMASVMLGSSGAMSSGPVL